MEDIAPQLIQSVADEFQKLYDSDSKIQTLLAKVHHKTATYAEAQEYALAVSQLIGKAFRKYVSSDVLPDGKLYYNIANRLIPESLDKNYRLVSQYAADVQTSLNQNAKIGLRSQTADRDQDRIDGLVDLASNADQYDDVADQLLTAFENYSQHIVDETIRKNADFHYRSGMTPKIIRKAEAKCCKWCRGLAGVHDYPAVDPDVYRRHENCRCTVLYDPADGSKTLQDVHKKTWTDRKDYAKIRARLTAGLMADDNRRYEKDIYIPLGVGAKQKDVKVKLPTGERIALTPGSRITHVQTIAGAGRNRQIDIVDLLVDKYPGTDPQKWQKKKGVGYVDYDGESYKAELHWYEEPSVGRVEYKVKPDADGNWFYEDE